MPDHPMLRAEQGNRFCIINFPKGQVNGRDGSHTVGTGPWQLLPGTYRYYDQNGGVRVSTRGECRLGINATTRFNGDQINLPYGETFEFTIHCHGAWLVRIGD